MIEADECGVLQVAYGELTAEPGEDDDNELVPEPDTAVAEDDLPHAIEAILLVVDNPVSETAVASAVGFSATRVRAELDALAAEYTRTSSGIELREFGGGWRFYTRDRFAHVVERFVLDGQQSRLSRAALETLAVIAYRQPVTRARIAAVRGVNVDGVIRTLTARGLAEDVGTDAETGGMLYRTTELFLERLGLSSLDDLPALGPLLPEIDAVEDE
ncbi:SMC-Scp complex subunit ScpB [Nakamurella antarctica]|uniref:SMC-Scp complex subunit ScpB n=1 Tax=Nakamurella antarctica TaxID=1902245 RepID=A0A3G8ZK71_9ACTN|nr:SMC-Scp complex subunit ScpB [Nakamurella antarctica]AZI57588.1 SMC-Scp complex subunit ScpB [Nakamurella antarctica]